MLEWSVQALRGVASVERIVVALPGDELAAAPDGTVAVAGGMHRSQSVLAALRASGDGDPVIVHDAARPLAAPELFLRALAELESSGADAVVAAMPVSDTIKEVGDDGREVTRTLNRERMWAVQTPQVFRRNALLRALEASVETLQSATDDAWLVEVGGGTVRVVLGAAENIKITTPVDLRVAELLLGERGQ
jgi:2-C-methyl-D-erythritol 4-phosphate cytidylyltransferase